jgi:hypothetical protein
VCALSDSNTHRVVPSPHDFNPGKTIAAVTNVRKTQHPGGAACQPRNRTSALDEGMTAMGQRRRSRPACQMSACLPDSGGIADIPQPRLGANMRHGMSQRQPTEARERKPLWLNVPPLLARCVFFLKTAFEYLSRVFSRERVPKFDNSRDLKVCELLCEELLHLSCSQRCLTIRLHCSNE